MGAILRNLHYKRRAWLALAPGLFWNAAAIAQTASSAATAPPANDRFDMSPGGVDMRSGRYVYNRTDLAIGGDTGLALTRTLLQPVLGHSSPLGNFSNNWEIMLSEKMVDIAHGNFLSTSGGGDFQIEVAFNGAAQTFRSTLSGFDEVSHGGYGQLTWTGGTNRLGTGIVYTVLTADGTTAVFRPIGTLASADCSTRIRCAYVSQLTRADGTVLSFDYDTPGGADTARLRTVTSSRGYALMFEYSGGLLSKACVLNLAIAPVPSSHLCPSTAQAMASYTYTSVLTAPGPSETRLASETDPAGATWGFVNTASTVGFVNPGDTTPWLVNTIWERGDDEGLMSPIVNSQAFADGSSYTYSYTFTPSVVGHVQTVAGGSWTDARGGSVTLAYDFPYVPHDNSQGHGNEPDDGGNPPQEVQQVTPGPITITDQLGRVTHFDYCDPTAAAYYASIHALNTCMVTPMPVSSTDPTGIRTDYTNDYSLHLVTATHRNPNSGSAPPISTATVYNCSATYFRSCNKPTSVTDANGHTTTYTYSPDHGGVLTERPPIPVAGAPQPEVRHIYTQRYAWLSDGAGGVVQAATPIWVETATSTCRSSAPTGTPSAPCTTAGDEVLTQYDYGPTAVANTLLLRGQSVTATDGGVTTTLRTCYGYDALGRRISQTAPNAGLGSCP